MKVILLEDVIGAGGAGDVVEVASGYARNKLLPSGIAIEANKANMKTLEHRRAKIAAKKAADKEMAQALAVRLEGKQVDFTAKAGESGKLFGSVTAQDIAEAVHETLGFEIDRRRLLLDAPFKEVGLHDVKYRIYPEVEATIKVNIVSEGGPVLPPAETLKDTYADEDLEDEEDGGEGNYVYDARDEEVGAAVEAAVETGEEA
jgi:large subunit ribosomal protein L9